MTCQLSAGAYSYSRIGPCWQNEWAPRKTSFDFTALAAEVDRIAARPVSPQFPTETMVRILVLKHLYNLSDEQMEYQLPAASRRSKSCQESCRQMQGVVPVRGFVYLIWKGKLSESWGRKVTDLMGSWPHDSGTAGIV